MVKAMHEKPFHEVKGESPVHQAGNLLLGQNCIKMDSPWGSNFCNQVDRFNRKSGLVDKVVRGLSWRPFSFFLCVQLHLDALWWTQWVATIKKILRKLILTANHFKAMDRLMTSAMFSNSGLSPVIIARAHLHFKMVKTV